MFFFKSKWKKDFESEIKLIEREISQSKRFKLNFSVLAIEISHSVPRGLSKILPGQTISFHVLKQNLRLYDQLSNYSFRRYYVILPQTDENGVEAVKNRIYKLAQEHNWGDISIKAANYPKDGESSKALLDKIS